MTFEEVIERLKCMKLFMQINDKDSESKFLEEDYEANSMAIAALEKQIPKELTNIRKVKKYDGYDMGCCPVCGEPLDNSFYENLKYCFVCGQAIKWE